MYEDDFDSLKGKKIISFELIKTTANEYDDEEDTDGIRFHLENGHIDFRAYGDCCSTSYIEDLDNPDIFSDAIFESFETIEGESKEDPNGYDEHKWTFYKFKTSKGLCTLSFRNTSNGYYNGHLELVKKR